MTAEIPWQADSANGTVYATGWFDLYKKDMQARIEVEGIDGVYLHPYYSEWVDLENSRIKAAKLNFFSDILGKNNEVTANCRLELADIEFRPRPPEQSEHKAEKITTAILGLFRAMNQGRVVLNFVVKTSMDRPEFNFDSINQAVDKTISEGIQANKIKVEDMALLPAKFLKEITRGATEATKALINGTLSVGKNIMGALSTEEGTEKISNK